MTLFGLFIEGILSFLSPCVLPLIPLYMSYLSADAKEADDEGNISYKSGRVFLMTVFFVLGISVVFLLLALSVKAIRPFIEKYSDIIAIIGGTLIIIFGLHETGIITIDVLNSEKKLNLNMERSGMNYLKAFILGFLFSFAWTPCIGPMLASAILIASTETYGSLYILVYAAGLIIPFLFTGAFTSFVLNFIRNKKHIFRYVMIVAGLIMIAYGVYMIVNASRNITSVAIPKEDVQEDTAVSTSLPDTQFIVHNGDPLYFSDYEGKYIFLNFTATWCGYCEGEIEDYLAFSRDSDEYVCFYVMSTLTSQTSKDEIIKYIDEHDIDIRIPYGIGKSLLFFFRPEGYPTKYVAGKNGEILGYFAGVLDKDGFNMIFDAAKELEKQ